MGRDINPVIFKNLKAFLGVFFKEVNFWPLILDISWISRGMIALFWRKMLVFGSSDHFSCFQWESMALTTPEVTWQEYLIVIRSEFHALLPVVRLLYFSAFLLFGLSVPLSNLVENEDKIFLSITLAQGKMTFNFKQAYGTTVFMKFSWNIGDDVSFPNKAVKILTTRILTITWPGLLKKI